MASTHWDIIHPAWTLRCVYLLKICQSLRSFGAEDNVQKTSFRGLPYKRLGGLCSINTATPRQFEASFIALGLHVLSIDVRPAHPSCTSTRHRTPSSRLTESAAKLRKNPKPPKRFGNIFKDKNQKGTLIIISYCTPLYLYYISNSITRDELEMN
jgi:hypothetical protein